MIRRLAMSLAVLVLASTPGAAQRADCTWDACALRLQYRVFTTSIVAGAGAQPVARFGFLAPRIGVFESAPDSIRTPYTAFRRQSNRSTIFVLLAAAAGVVAISSPDVSDGTRLGLVLAGGTLGLVGGLYRSSANDHLEQAIWRYNGAIAARR